MPWPQFNYHLAVVFLFSAAIGPMNLVASVKPGAGELNDCEMTGARQSYESLVPTDLRPSLGHMSWSNVTANIL